jgi:hypothetical protein
MYSVISKEPTKFKFKPSLGYYIFHSIMGNRLFPDGLKFESNWLRMFPENFILMFNFF